VDIFYFNTLSTSNSFLLEKVFNMNDQSISKGQLLALTLFLTICIVSVTALLIMGETRDFVPILIILVATLDSIYIMKIFNYKLSRKIMLKWVTAIILFNVFAIPFFWKKFL
jgi:hypothetical protein